MEPIRILQTIIPYCNGPIEPDIPFVFQISVTNDEHILIYSTCQHIERNGEL
jgi:hypothetical protein